MRRRATITIAAAATLGVAATLAWRGRPRVVPAATTPGSTRVAGGVERSTTKETIGSASGVEAWRVHASSGGGGAAFGATVIRFDRGRVVARLVDVGQGSTLRDVTGSPTLVINGGYFEPSYRPLGLYRTDGWTRVPLLARPPLSGVVTIDERGRLDVVPRDDASVRAARSAFQAGPFLVDSGGTPGIRGDDGKQAERTVLALDAAGLSVVVTTPATLHAVAEALHAAPGTFGLSRVDRAINLDGGPSSAFLLRVGDATIWSPPRTQLRSAIVFAAR